MLYASPGQAGCKISFKSRYQSFTSRAVVATAARRCAIRKAIYWWAMATCAWARSAAARFT